MKFIHLNLCSIEKATGCHHLYSSYPRKGNASLSREKTVNAEDENMSPTQRKTNGEPSRDEFMKHEEDTWSNSELNHSQMPLTHSFLHQYEMRQRRNQAHKVHNVAKPVSQVEQ
ncbi:hypothetical protein O181_061496 [Austropuccinia psidii MF-1]|uniref:Uncharacterized protein n=1 Tax=Austropuccinia psidii MF-1 TaxID=1389203 RepID=A0A9Q3EMX2_9BASI|nr:hypothetical protein [Austropuccinia psidii MF-1]